MSPKEQQQDIDATSLTNSPDWDLACGGVPLSWKNISAWSLISENTTRWVRQLEFEALLGLYSLDEQIEVDNGMDNIFIGHVFTDVARGLAAYSNLNNDGDFLFAN